jgi:hypothetical protein
MSTGIGASDEAIALADLVRTNKLDWASFKIENTEVVPDTQFPISDDDKAARKADRKEKTWEANWEKRVFPTIYADAKTHPKEARFYMTAVGYELKDGGKRDKLVLLTWVPDAAPVKIKMTSAGTLQSFAKRINVPKTVQASQLSDITYADLISDK